jgi:formylglycine-generating enzyme required for sulfatase activity
MAWSALADCLEEKGQAQRAELVRLSRLPPAGKKARAAAEARVRELLAAGVLPCVPILENSIGMRLALITPGTFLMGSPNKEAERSEDEGPQHEVEITRPFYLGVFPVTQAQYRKATRGNPSYFRPGGSSGEWVRGLDTSTFPVEGASWDDAVAFCQKLSAVQAERKAGRVYRLPSEAEWEYACRAGTTTPFHLGRSLSHRQANFGYTLGRTCKVGSYKPNAWGLFDMHGNVWEWCADRYEEGFYRDSPREDPTGPGFALMQVVRGGSWGDAAHSCRSAVRSCHLFAARADVTGFRVACDIRGRR